MRSVVAAVSLTLSLGMIGTGSLALAQGLELVDKTFAKDAAQAALAEGRIGELAKERAASPDAKALGERLVTDQAKLMDELKNICSRRDYAIPTEPNAGQKEAIDRLSKLSGSEFDREFARVLTDYHKKIVRLFEVAQEKVGDEDLKQFAKRSLPVLEEHVKSAEKLSSKVGQGT
jgi:putative membrane protein